MRLTRDGFARSEFVKVFQRVQSVREGIPNATTPTLYAIIDA